MPIRVKIFDYEDELDLEEDVNSFISNNNIEVIDIKYQVSASVFSEEQIFCFSAMIIYNDS
ncbi:MAG: sporulation protein Cse60 [Bacilli bacterium]|nr:sporulation protein Cse60 [Bacilli bacterium]MBR2998081.1 sporulation protein Cse60 [Bacilli bacterium]